MIHILSILPYPDMREAVSSAMSRYPRAADVANRVVVAAVDRLDSISLAQCDAVVARGYTARRLKAENPDALIVEIDISGYDVIRSIQECREACRPQAIAFVGFYSAFNGIEQFSGMFGCKIRVYIPSSYDNVDAVVQQAMQDGCDAIIGGYSAYLAAKNRQCPAFIVGTGEEAYGRALDEAVRMVELLRQERIKTRLHQLIIQSSRDGILYVDAGGIIRVANSAAQAMNGSHLLDRPLAEVFPCMRNCFSEAQDNAREILGELRRLNELTISLDCAPVVVDDQPAGVVISFQSITKVQQLEGQIRKKLSKNGLVAKHRFTDIIHRSRVIDETIENARRYAHASANILIVGETGTGKELFAQSVHNESPRSDGPFVAVNCAALPENLLESELFGYVEGAFTGTVRGGKMGLFELAHNGTLFLDEISEIAISVQSKLLRVLQEREVRRIGDDKVMSVDVRVISATNANLYTLVSKGQFRQDLLYRLDVLKIVLPPLRHREDDVVELFHFFLTKFATKRGEPVPAVDPGALALLTAYSFTGNTRELRNIVERVGVLRRQTGLITPEDMERALYPEDLDGAIPASAEHFPPELGLIRKALADCRGNQTRAAKLLGIDRSTLWRKLRKLSAAEKR